MDEYRIARDKGGGYLQNSLRDDGGFGDPNKGAIEYYKVPTALLVCGKTEAASRLLGWIRRDGTTLEGDFVPRPDDHQNSYFYAYHNIWIIMAAQRMGQFDLSRNGMGFILDFWDPASGGFYSSPSERTEHTLQDLWVVSGCGIAALYTGMLEVAEGVGYWMKRLMSLQPEYPQKLYTVYSRSHGLYTPENPVDEFRYVLDSNSNRDQSFYHPGIAGGFLARLYQATGNSEWLTLSKEYMRLPELATDHLWSLLRAGKVGWCASILYTLTGDECYKDMAIRVGNNLIATQTEEGYWTIDGSDTPSNDTTAEMVVWLDEIYQSVGRK